MPISLPINYNSYYLTEPLKFQRKKEEIKEIPQNYTLLKTLKTAICASDIHYYLGQKSKEKLKKRLPLILLHEGVCLDVRTGIKVIPMAGDVNKVSVAYVGRENLSPDLDYLGATMNGLARQYFVYPQNLVIPISPLINESVASLVEPLSIALKALKDMDIHYYNEIAVIGDGGLAYLLSFLMKHYFNISKNKLRIYGVNDSKLDKFSSFGEIININKNKVFSKAEIILEAVGGRGIQNTLDLAFELSTPGSRIGVLGISDVLPKLQINKLVNSGVSIRGLTRSTYEEYEFIVDFLKNKKYADSIAGFIDPKEFIISTEKDLEKAFEYATSFTNYGRVIVRWDK